MQSLSTASATALSHVRYVLTDMDETLTYRGRLSARTYDALERLQNARVRVIPVTAAPAGWCDQMARMWPIDGVIAENGGVFIQRHADRHGVYRHFWHTESERPEIAARLSSIGQELLQALPFAKFADDQPFRLTSLAFGQPEAEAEAHELIHQMRKAGLDVTTNNLWILGWLGGYDKLKMSRRIMAEIYNVNIDAERASILYCGDSVNDAPMFEFFEQTVGVSTVRQYLPQLPIAPRWITEGPGGAGFVEVADMVLAGRAT